MPTFCRHNRFIERCPICSKTLPGYSPAPAGSPRATSTGRAASARRTAGGRRASSKPPGGPPRRPRAESLRVRREDRAQDDGYRSALLPGVRASADADRLAQEIAFSSGRLLALAAAPWGLYGEARALAAADLERATWTCFLICYLGPLEGEDPFAPTRLALEAARDPREDCGRLSQLLAEPGGIALGPRSSHDPARGSDTLVAYRGFLARAGGSQASAFLGDPAWSPERRFGRLFERLALPGFGRMGRYELLVTLGTLGLYELRADSLHLLGVRSPSQSDLTTLGAKRLFAIGDPVHLERRAAALAQASAVPLAALDLALANWAAPQRTSAGCPPGCSDEAALQRARGALGL